MGKKSGKKTKFKTQDVQPKGGASKKEQFTAHPKTGSKGGGKVTLVGLGVVAVFLAVVAFVMFGGGGGGFQTVTAEAGMIRIPMADVSDGHAHFYSYDGSSRRINFFVLRSSDGVVRAAFDACDVCFREKKGYRQEGDLMVCNNCGQQFPSVKINEIRGGCNPAPLSREVQGQYLVLRSSDIEQGSFYF